MYPEKNGVGYAETADFGPCAVWDADLWKCRGCEIEILHGFGQGPVAHHWQGELFERALKDYEEKSILIHERRWKDDSHEDS